MKKNCRKLEIDIMKSWQQRKKIRSRVLDVEMGKIQNRGYFLDFFVFLNWWHNQYFLSFWLPNLDFFWAWIAKILHQIFGNYPSNRGILNCFHLHILFIVLSFWSPNLDFFWAWIAKILHQIFGMYRSNRRILDCFHLHILLIAKFG